MAYQILFRESNFRPTLTAFTRDLPPPPSNLQNLKVPVGIVSQDLSLFCIVINFIEFA